MLRVIICKLTLCQTGEKPLYKACLFSQRIINMENKDYKYIDIEEKWQKQWFENKIFESKKEKQKNSSYTLPTLESQDIFMLDI